MNNDNVNICPSVNISNVNVTNSCLSKNIISNDEHKSILNTNNENNIGIKCLSTNTDSLNNKMELLENFVFKENIDVVALQEIHNKNETQDIKDSKNFILPGYQTFQNNTGRGVCLFVKQNHYVEPIPEFEHLFSPSIFCRISNPDGQHFVFGVIYRSPNCTTNETNDLNNQIKFVANKTLSSNEKLILVGDFNYKEIDWENEICHTALSHQGEKHIAEKFF